MFEFLGGLFSTKNFMPHGHCYLWKPLLLWLQVGSNALIGLSYVAISCTLAYLVYRIQDLPFQRIYVAFGLFIITCGFTHFMDILTIWQPVYWADGGMRAITAVASIGTAVMLPFLVPKAIAFARSAKIAHDKGIRIETAYQQLGKVFEKNKELDQLKTQFFANVSHELRTPLALILGPAERMHLAPNLTDDQRRDLDVMSRNAKTLLKHVNDLLDVSKLEAGKMKPSYAQTDLSRLIRIVAGNFDGLARERQIFFIVKASDALSVEIDPGMIQRVLLNLLSNAFKFVPDNGTIQVTAEKRDSWVTVSVADTGPGIPEDIRRSIFERFRQVDETVTRKHGGVGLGLSIVKEFIELHQGKVQVGEAPMGGALFIFEIPVKAPNGVEVRADSIEQLKDEASKQELEILRVTTQRLEAAVPQAGGKKATLLVVEDNPDMNRFLADLLSTEYHVETAFHGKDGLEKTVTVHPDLILTDIMMPVMSGDQMVAEIRKNHEFEGTPIVLLTAKADDELKNRLLREGAQDYVIKPFSSEELLTRVKNLVTMKRARDALQRELESQLQDLETLALEVGLRKRELQATVKELRVAKDTAERASSAKSVFLGLVSHELKTPMTSLALQLQILRRIEGKNLSSTQLEVVRKLEKSSTLIIEITDTLLEFTRIQSGKTQIVQESFDLFDLVSGIVESARPQAQDKKLEFTITSSPEVPALQSDPVVVQLVMRNLISNAIKYTEKGWVEVNVTFEQGAHSVSVRDTGPGIPKEQQEVIFQPFQQLSPLDKKSKSGFGLGLAIARDSIRALGGKIELLSEVGKGSTFTVKFPPLKTEPTKKDNGLQEAA